MTGDSGVLNDAVEDDGRGPAARERVTRADRRGAAAARAADLRRDGHGGDRRPVPEHPGSARRRMRAQGPGPAGTGRGRPDRRLPGRAARRRGRAHLGRTPAGPGPRALLERIDTFIDHNLGDPALAPQSIADRHHISVRRLHLLFQDRGRASRPPSAGAGWNTATPTSPGPNCSTGPSTPSPPAGASAAPPSSAAPTARRTEPAPPNGAPAPRQCRTSAATRLRRGSGPAPPATTTRPERPTGPRGRPPRRPYGGHCHTDPRAPRALIGAQLGRGALPEVLRPYPDDPLGEDRPRPGR